MRSDHLTKHIQTHRKPSDVSVQDTRTPVVEDSESMPVMAVYGEHCDLSMNETSIGIDPCYQVNKIRIPSAFEHVNMVDGSLQDTNK